VYLKFTSDVSPRLSEKYELQREFVNPHLLDMLIRARSLTSFARGVGSHLFGPGGEKYLDLRAGSGVFAVGRSHPAVVAMLRDVLEAELPTLCQLDMYALAGLLAERLISHAPTLDQVFFCNSGTEATEAAIKFARMVTGRSGILYCEGAFHGLTYGSLSINGDEMLREGFGPFLPGCMPVRFNNLEDVEKALQTREFAAFILEPIQSRCIEVPNDDFLPEVARMCRKFGSLLVVDEIQTGMGRTGRFLASEHWGVEPDLVLLAKALSGGFVPVGAVLMRQTINDVVFGRNGGRVVHGSTFARNDLAMAAGLATMDVIEKDRLLDRSRVVGLATNDRLQALISNTSALQGVTGKGLMLGLHFSDDQPARGASEVALEVIERLHHTHRILTDTSSASEGVAIFRPPLNVAEEDLDWLVAAVSEVTTLPRRDCNRSAQSQNWSGHIPSQKCAEPRVR
jgi:ornithine--oxo-acid transaminase